MNTQCRAMNLATLIAMTVIAGGLAGCGGGGGGGSSSGSASSSSSGNAPIDRTIVPNQLQVPTLAYDERSITLVWKKPDNYANVVDYKVYQDGKLLGSADANNTLFSPAKPYIDQFYKDDTAKFHVKAQIHNYIVDGLQPNTSYTFTVRAVLKDGSESVDSVALTHKTAPTSTTVADISRTATAGDTTDASVIAANTVAIQKAIDDCARASVSAYGCKVLVPSGVYVTGALFLKSNMTLEIAEGATLKGSPYSADYPLAKGYQLYSYDTTGTTVKDDRRSPSLLNLLSADHLNGSQPGARQGYDETRGVFTNVRVVGKGTLDGNGWKRASASGSGRPDEIIDETGSKLPQYASGSAKTTDALGILAKAQMDAVKAEVRRTLNDSELSAYYGTRRASLTTFRGVKNIYFGGLKLLNPAFHGVMFLESDNIVFANTNSQTFDTNNGDGVEFGNSDNMMVFNNFFDTGDDNVNYAAGQGKPYENGRASQNGWIFNNYMREGHGVVALGSHTGSWIQDIVAEDNVAYLTDNGLRMKSNVYTGGGARRITFRDNAMRSVGALGAESIAGGIKFKDGGNNGQPFIFTLGYSTPTPGGFQPGSIAFEKAASAAQYRDITVLNVSLDNVDATKGVSTIKVDAYDGKDTGLGYPESFHENLLFENVKIKDSKPVDISRLKNSVFTNVSVTQSGSAVPASWWAFKDANPGNTFTNVTPRPLPQ